jgi:LysM repeat protein
VIGAVLAASLAWGAEHVIRGDDTLQSIAAAWSTDVPTLQRLNGLVGASLPAPGAVLLVPDRPGSASVPAVLASVTGTLDATDPSGKPVVAQIGAALAPGSVVCTGADSYATVRLAATRAGGHDDVSLDASTCLKVVASTGAAAGRQSRLDLRSGSVSVRAGDSPGEGDGRHPRRAGDGRAGRVPRARRAVAQDPARGDRRRRRRDRRGARGAGGEGLRHARRGGAGAGGTGAPAGAGPALVPGRRHGAPGPGVRVDAGRARGSATGSSSRPRRTSRSWSPRRTCRRQPTRRSSCSCRSGCGACGGGWPRSIAPASWGRRRSRGASRSRRGSGRSSAPVRYRSAVQFSSAASGTQRRYRRPRRRRGGRVRPCVQGAARVRWLRQGRRDQAAPRRHRPPRDPPAPPGRVADPGPRARSGPAGRGPARPARRGGGRW